MISRNFLKRKFLSPPQYPHPSPSPSLPGTGLTRECQSAFSAGGRLARRSPPRCGAAPGAVHGPVERPSPLAPHTCALKRERSSNPLPLQDQALRGASRPRVLAALRAAPGRRSSCSGNGSELFSTHGTGETRLQRREGKSLTPATHRQGRSPLRGGDFDRQAPRPPEERWGLLNPLLTVRVQSCWPVHSVRLLKFPKIAR